MVNNLNIDPTGYVDVSGWGVVTTTPFATVNGYITDGVTGQLRSSKVANDPNFLYGLAAMKGQDYNDFVGGAFHLRSPVLNGDSLLQATYWGDFNLDGITDSLDYGYINFAYDSGDPANTGWIFGDFDRSGVVDSLDYGYINYVYDYLTVNPPVGGASAQAVPEPSVVVLLISALVGLVVYRRKR